MTDTLTRLIDGLEQALTAAREMRGDLEDCDTLYHFATSRLETLENDSTRTAHVGTFNLLHQETSVPLNHLDRQWLNGIDDLLHDHPKAYKQSTISKHHRNLKRWIREAIRQELIRDNQNPYRHFTIPSTKGRETYLTEAEIDLFESATESVARDVFLFSCYTGLRYSDLVALTRDNFIRDGDKVYIVVDQIKTGNPVKIPAHKVPSSAKLIHLIDTFTGFDLDNHTLNSAIKRIAEEVGIAKNLFIHAARHTFGTRLARQGYNATVIQKLMGHTDMAMTQKYIHLEGSDIEDLM